MSCTVHVCHADDEDSVCSNGCFLPKPAVDPLVAAVAALEGQVSITEYESKNPREIGVDLGEQIFVIVTHKL